MHEEAIDRAVCKTRCGRGYGPVERTDTQLTNAAASRIIQPGARGLYTNVQAEPHGYRYGIFTVRTIEQRTMRARRSVQSTEFDWHIVDTLNVP